MKKKKKTTKTSRSRRSKGTKRPLRKGRTGKRSSFSTLWRRIGNAVLRAAEKGHGCDRKTVVSKLSSDADLQRLIVERTVRLLAATAERSCSSSVSLLDATPRQEDPMADEYVLASRSSEACCGNDGAEASTEEEKADWRVL